MRARRERKGEQEAITYQRRGGRRESLEFSIEARKTRGEPLTIVAPREELTIVSRLIPALATNVALGQSKNRIVVLRPRKNAEWSGDGWIEREREREREMSLSAMENVTKCFKCLAKRDATNGRGTREKRRGCFDYISAEEFVRPSFPFREYVLFVFRNYSFFFFF